MGGNFQIWWLLLFQLFPTIMHIRYLRTLPVSVFVLAATLVLVPVAAIICLGGLIAALTEGGPLRESVFSGYLLASAIGALSVAVLVWRGADRNGMALFMAVIFFGSFGPPFLHTERILILATAVIVMSLVALAIEITRRALIRSLHTYRAPQVNAWGMMGWRS